MLYVCICANPPPITCSFYVILQLTVLFCELLVTNNHQQFVYSAASMGAVDAGIGHYALVWDSVESIFFSTAGRHVCL